MVIMAVETGASTQTSRTDATDLENKCFDHKIDNATTEIDPVDEGFSRRVTLKIDMHILPLLMAIYTMTFLDRVNIGNARLWKMEADLGMKGLDFNICVLVFYIPYIILELPSNYIISRVKPRYWLSGLIMGFGLTVTFAGFCTTFAGLVTARVFVGIFEAGMFPGCMFLISSWYTRRQLGARIAWFLVANDIAGSVSGLLGAGLGSLDGTHGYSGWSWIFFIEGAATCVVAVVAFFCVPPFPKESKFLTAEEKGFLLRRLAIDDNHYDGEDNVKAEGILKALADWKLICTCIMYLGICITAYSISVFQPTILQTFGWNSMKSNLLTAPVRIASGIISVLAAHWSNHLRMRGVFIIFGFAVSIAGDFLVMLVHNYKIRYFGLYLSAVGIYIAMPLVMAWGVNQVVGKTKRGTMTATAISTGQIGGIISALVYPKKDGPYYIPGTSVCIAFAALGLITACVMWFFLARENKARDAGKRDHRRHLPNNERNKLGDKHPDFRYTI